MKRSKAIKEGWPLVPGLVVPPNDGKTAPFGFVLLIGADGAQLLGSDGAYLYGVA